MKKILFIFIIFFSNTANSNEEIIKIATVDNISITKIDLKNEMIIIKALNKFKEIFDNYKIVDYAKFKLDDTIKDANIAATLLKITERKTAKGNSYGVIKFTDLTSVFGLFIFSDILELNREILKEGNSLLLTLVKSISNDENRFKRVNVQKIGSMMDLFNSPINEVFFEVNSSENLDEISKLLAEEGKTDVNIRMVVDEKILEFRLKNSRNLDRKSLNLLRKREISSTIN